MAKAKTAKKFDLKKFMSIYDIKDQSESLNFVSLAPNLDVRMGGGAQEASFLLLRTLPKVGKTTLLSCFAKNSCMQKRHTWFFDTESRVSKRNFFREGITEEEYEAMAKYLHVEQLKRGSQFESGNDVYEFIFQQMQKPAMDGSVYIIDSFSKIITREHLADNEVRADRRDTTPKLNADFCKKVGTLLRSSKSIVVGVQHFNNDPNKWGNSLSPVGGLKFDYDADYVLETMQEPKDLDGNPTYTDTTDPESKLEGNLIYWQIPYNKIQSPIMTKKQADGVKTYLRYDTGVDRMQEIYEVLTKFGDSILVKGGGNHEFVMENDIVKIRGKEAVKAFMNENKEYFEKEYKKFLESKFGEIKYESSNKDTPEEFGESKD